MRSTLKAPSLNLTWPNTMTRATLPSPTEKRAKALPVAEAVDELAVELDEEQ